MIAEAGNVLRQAFLITGFVFVMMLVIEYINVQTRGLWHQGQKETVAGIIFDAGITPSWL